MNGMIAGVLFDVKFKNSTVAVLLVVIFITSIYRYILILIVLCNDGRVMVHSNSNGYYRYYQIFSIIRSNMFAEYIRINGDNTFGPRILFQPNQNPTFLHSSPPQISPSCRKQAF